MLESEVKSLISFILGRCQIMESLFLSHGIPFLVPLVVSPDVIDLHQHVENDVHASDGEELLIPAPIERCVIYLGQFLLFNEE